MIYTKEYARLIGNRLTLVGLYNRCAVIQFIDKPGEFIQYIFEIKDQKPVHIAFEIERENHLGIIPELTAQIVTELIHYVEKRSKE